MNQNEKGSALIVAIFLVTVLTLLGVGVMSTAMNDLKVSDSYVNSLEALYAADAGLNDTVSMLEIDRTIGTATADPTANPLYEREIDGRPYSIWIWKERLWGNGEIEAFDDPEKRQVIVVGSDGQNSTRRLEAILEPARTGPEAIGRFAAFSCGDMSLEGGGDDMQGIVYASGTLFFDHSSHKPLSLEATGNITIDDKVEEDGGEGGNVTTNGNIIGPTQDVDMDCIAGGTISNTSKCDGSYSSFVSPDPVPDYCDTTDPDYDPRLLEGLTVRMIDGHRDNADTHHTTGWTLDGAADQEISGIFWIEGGDVLWKDTKFKIMADTLILAESNFTCDRCEIQMDSGLFSIITVDGNMTFTGNKKAEIVGAIWAGVWAAGVPPTNGSIIVTNDYELEIAGSAIAAAGPITAAAGTKFDAMATSDPPIRPSYFGNADAYAITEWLESR